MQKNPPALLFRIVKEVQFAITSSTCLQIQGLMHLLTMKNCKCRKQIKQQLQELEQYLLHACLSLLAQIWITVTIWSNAHHYYSTSRCISVLNKPWTSALLNTLLIQNKQKITFLYLRMSNNSNSGAVLRQFCEVLFNLLLASLVLPFYCSLSECLLLAPIPSFRSKQTQWGGTVVTPVHHCHTKQQEGRHW
jgi:hypothetical protein